MIIRKTLIFSYIFFAALLISSCSQENPTDSVELPLLNAEDLAIPEGDNQHTVQVRVVLDRPAVTNVIVRYSTKNGSAIAGRDYVAIADQTLTIPSGQNEALIPVRIIGNTFFEPDKSFELVVVNAINARLGKNIALITLLNDDDNVPGSIKIPGTGNNSPLEYDGYTLVWSDEFQFPELDDSKWRHEIGTGNNGWGNNELQYYRSENTFIHNNEYLVIEARQEPFGSSQYTSSRIITSEKASFKYGRVDIRASLPKGQGLWPALWMLGDSFWTRGWPACGEIDIMEKLGHQTNRVYGTAHWGPNFSQRQLKERSIFSGPDGDFHERFHVFSIIWEENKIEWYMDNQLFNTLTPEDMNGFEYPFNESFFFIFNVAVGGNWPGSPDATTIFPQYMIVDYIRVFQKSN